MSGPRVLVVAATHGNECNAAWLLEGWRAQPHTLDSHGLELALEIGNPAAYAANCRYVERDLNRSFAPPLLVDPRRQELEVRRARELLAVYGATGPRPACVAIDLHSTTSAMGNSLVVYGRRPADLALAAGVQARLGLPIYLHEGDAAQTGFLVERWPSGLVIEVGPVPQGVIEARICRQTQLGLEAALAVIGAAGHGCLRLPRHLVVHRHRASLDLPRDADGTPMACLDPRRQGCDWQPIQAGDGLFCRRDGRGTAYAPPADLVEGPAWPVFINEAAYGEKGIALSLTSREIWPVEAGWGEALTALLER
ncbi:MAG: aspartoacylase [Cyanobacteriota bacterium]